MTEGKLYTATITMTVNFLAPAKVGPIVGEAQVTQLGKTIAFVEGKLTAADGAVLATSHVERTIGRDGEGDSIDVSWHMVVMPRACWASSTPRPRRESKLL